MDSITGYTGSSNYPPITGYTGATGPAIQDVKLDPKKQFSFFAKWIWAVACLGAIILIGTKAHAPVWLWVACLAVWAGGDYYEGYQFRTTTDSTLTPYVLQVVGVAAMMLSAA
jgi:hypothetical protein